MTDSSRDVRPARIELPFRVRFDEATPDGLLRGSALLGYVHDAAWRHSEVLGFTRDWYRERSLAWLVRAIEAVLLEPVHDNDALLVSTRISGWRRVMARRSSDVAGADGRILAKVLVDWAMTDGMAPALIPDEFRHTHLDSPGSFAPLRVALPLAPPGTVALRFAPRARELDPMGHVNNGVYLDWLDETVGAAGGQDAVVAFPRRYRLEYLHPAGPDARLVSAAWPDSGGWAYRLAGEDGTELLRGRLDTHDVGPA